MITRRDQYIESRNGTRAFLLFFRETTLSHGFIVIVDIEHIFAAGSGWSVDSDRYRSSPNR